MHPDTHNKTKKTIYGFITCPEVGAGYWYSYVNFKAELGVGYFVVVDGYNSGSDPEDAGEETFCLSVLQ
jgi:hypothetical protein